MTLITKQELLKLGAKVNPNMWLGDGFMYCANCRQYRYHFAMTLEHGSCYEVCERCNCYSGREVDNLLEYMNLDDDDVISTLYMWLYLALMKEPREIRLISRLS